ncbi:hypothetical protein [Flagellimonas marinaquae]|jgi:hypothetical protein|uniref:Uncharacterized protein n=1 Tax=Flagellimonas marinaquae TaxID=254955 RepID=A0AA48KQ95_9FLAO|nr:MULTISPECIES: hypothetical protein [Allomuricauda]USD24984.1 hypothetical protein MJO53_15010 [Allomuricauda aquimarina]BDW93995.1 hypothetical protein MACH07_28270 [Allomuricauda aquimarina]
MGGEGSMMHAIKSMKLNRSMLKKRKLKSKDDVYGTKNVTELYFKKSTQRDIARIRKKMFIQKEKEKRHMIYAVIATIIFFFILYLLLIP